jgi:hypothetical protein
MSEAGLRVGVYVDAENLSRNGGERMQYRVLRNIACREAGQAIRLNGKEVGFFRFLERTDGNLWLRDERDDHSPYGAAAFHVNNMPSGFDESNLPSREIVFEFELESADGYDRPRARDITVACRYPAV